MCFIVYGLKTQCSKKKKTDDEEQLTTDGSIPLSPGTKMAQQTKLKTDINPLLLAIPATFDFCGSTLMFVALTQCAASVYQMMRGAIVVITAAMAVIFLGRKQYVHHILSLVVIVLAVAIVGLVGVLHTKDDGGDDTGKTTILGVLLLVIAQCFTGG